MTRVLLTGATGYVGSRLLPRLLETGAVVRCMARRPERIRGPEGHPGRLERVRADVLNPADLRAALQDVDVAVYLIHSMEAGRNFKTLDGEAAARFGRAAAEAGVRRIVYLGGLGHGPNLSEHLASRQETGRILASSGVPVIELRASVIIGSGSLSFEMVRSLVDRLPIMITPRWVSTAAQPIGIDDVLSYLTGAVTAAESVKGVFEIGGSDVVSYMDLMLEYARRQGLKRRMIRVPVLSPRLSSVWLGLVTPLQARIGRSLIEGVRNETVVRDRRALEVFDVRPQSVGAAIESALREGVAHPPREIGRLLIDSREVYVDVAPERAFEPIRAIGGSSGWYFATWLWRVRAMLDRVVGGPGMRLGRRHPHDIQIGDPLDFWRVEAVEEGSLLRLAAEMKVPGRAWLEFRVAPHESGCSIRQTAIFEPAGAVGWAYWYLLKPLHDVVFHGMLRSIARRAASWGNEPWSDAAHARPSRG